MGKKKGERGARRHVEGYFVTVDPAEVASTVTAQFMQAKVEFDGYKGAVIMTIEAPGCCPSSPHRASAWLYDDDFDNLIAALRKAKRGWKKTDNQAAREKLARDRERARHAKR